ncbi:MAG: flagellar biosynthetic protein FliR [Polyangiaceae bacterium]|nr:flagellar biosynthetic protein FliR [Polyangiaceae bacterium]
MTGWVEALATALERAGIDLPRLGLAWARVAPSVTLVPAFGLRAIPAPGRALLALSLAVTIAPAVSEPVMAGLLPAPGAIPAAGAWALLALGETARGLPVAIAAAVPLWAATMAGGVADALRGSQGTASVPVVEGRASPTGVMLSILASAGFLSSGGPARVASALAAATTTHAPLVAAVADLARGTSVAVALGAPILGASVIIDVASALVARAASPAQIQAVLAPARALGALAVLALVFDRLNAALATFVMQAP